MVLEPVPPGPRRPDPDTVRRYAESVPEDFPFTVKVHKAITLTRFYQATSDRTCSYLSSASMAAATRFLSSSKLPARPRSVPA